MRGAEMIRDLRMCNHMLGKPGLYLIEWKKKKMKLKIIESDLEKGRVSAGN